jgi:hypothetical protein
MEHVFGGLLKVFVACECGEGDFLRKEIHFEDIAFRHCVLKVAPVAPVVLQGWSDIPTNLAVFTKGCSRFGGGVCNNFGAGRGERGAIEVKVPEQRGMS